MSVNSGLMLEWGMPIEGREMAALEEFMTSVGWWGVLKQQGKIADFRVYGPVTGDFKRTGFAVIEGTKAQIDELQASEEFRMRLQHVLAIGHNISLTVLEMGDAMTTRMQRYGRFLQEGGPATKK